MEKRKVEALAGLLERRDWAEDILGGLREVASSPETALHQFVEVGVPTRWLVDLIAKAESEVESIDKEIEAL